MAQIETIWQVAEIGEFYTLTLSSEAVVCSVALPPGLWEVRAEGDSIYVANGQTTIAAIPTADGSFCTWVPDGGGIWVHLPDDWTTRYLAVKRTGATTVTVYLQRRG